MERKSPRSRSPRTSGMWLLTASTAFLMLACVTRWTRSENNTAPQGWWSERGPVVPHDSFPSDCRLCHEGGDWSSIRDDFAFDHEAETGVPLEGAHTKAECLRCHNDRGPVAVFGRRGCAGCHEDIHRGQLGQDCKLCHDERNWQPSEQIAEHSRTRFPLIGAHAATACWRCHTGAEVGNFSPVDTACESCHMDDLAGADDPDHIAAGFTTDCERCHTPTTWSSAGFIHPGFALSGGHAISDCTACHPGGGFSGTPTDCFACHMDDYNGTTDPNHVAGNFSTSCEDCHGTSTWEGASFRHTGITNGCVECHLADYQGTNDPDHANSGFSTNCEDCHTTNTWEGAFFQHTGITMGCVECHLSDYQGTNDPNHAAAGFPTSCELCHNTNTWDGANFNHNFPINSGPHKNFDCLECHTMPMNYVQFSCIDCHEHNKNDTDDDHSEVDGYIYASSACYDCHPTGKE